MTVIYTHTTPWQRCRATNTTDAAFPTLVRKLYASRPTGTGNAVAQTTRAIYDLVAFATKHDGPVPNAVQFKMFAVGADNVTGAARLYSWSPCIEGGNVATAYWEPTILCELAGTMSAKSVGLAGALVDETQKFADTMALTTGNDDVSIDLVSPADDDSTFANAAIATMDLKGAHFFEPVFKVGTATSVNGLFRFLF